MSNGFRWEPICVLELAETLSARALGQMRVGSSVSQVESSLGVPELPRTRIGRSRVWELLYGNVSVLVSAQIVASINIDFHCRRSETVRAGPLGDWRIKEWEAYAASEGLRTTRKRENLTLNGDGIAIGLTSSGELQMVSLF